jgi:ParB-like chromosome segregation protein Spo0J
LPTAEAATLDVAKHRKPVKRLTQADVGLLLKYHAEGLPQTEIAKRLGCTQPIVSRWLADLTDSTETAKAYLRGQGLTMARNIVKNGRAADHVAALKGLSVLHDEQQSSVTVIVGGTGQVNIGVGLSPTPVLSQGETLQISQQNPTASDK